jgi:hypothetical protein
MLEIIEKSVSQNFDSCIVEVPREFALANGFPEKCFVSMTMRNGQLISEIIEYKDQDEREVEEFIADFPTLNEEPSRSRRIEK